MVGSLTAMDSRAGYGTGRPDGQRPPVAIAGSIDDHCRYLTALRAAPGQASSDPVWVVMLAGIAECAHSVSVVARQWIGRRQEWLSPTPPFDVNLRALGTQTINSTLSSQTCGKIEVFRY